MSNKPTLPNAASFLVCEDCNMACKYCFEKDRIWKDYMTEEVALQALKYLAQNAKTNGFNDFNVMMFGGEPFLNLPIMEYCFEKGLEIAYQNNLRFTSTIVTNGTIMNDEVKRIINKYKNKIGLQIQLSVDGVKESHDMYRVMRSGKGSFDKIEKNINEFKKLFKEDDRSLSIHGCLNKKTLSYLYESYLFFRETWGFKQIWFMPIHAEDWDDKDVDVYKEQLQKIADYILEKAKQTKSIDEVQFYAPIDKCLLPDQRPSAPCGAGKNYITITAKGEIYPCHHFYYNDPEKTTKIGDVWNGIDEQTRKIFVDFDDADLSCHKENPDCEAYHCYRCIGDNWVINGSILSCVRGARCKMSLIERDIQVRIRKELESMGLINDKKSYQGNNPNNPACLCDIGGPTGNNPENPACLCDVAGHTVDDNKGCYCVSEGGSLSSGKTCHNEDHQCGERQCENKQDSEEFYLILKGILEELNFIKKQQEYILKELIVRK